MMNFAGGPAAPAFELIQIFCTKMGIETRVKTGGFFAEGIEGCFGHGQYIYMIS
jgi:hypothetical protein